MQDQLKSAALTLTMAFGIAGVAHASQQPAQPAERQMPQPGQTMGSSQMMGQPSEGSMMNNPEMRQRMAMMMKACQRMMDRMAAEQGPMPGMQQPQ